MHIVLFSPVWPPDKYPNGIATYCGQIKPALINEGHEVTILSPEPVSDISEDFENIFLEESYSEKFVRRIASLINPGYPLYSYVVNNVITALKRIDNEKTIDIFEIEESFGWHLRISKKCNFPVVTRFHGPHSIVGVPDSNYSKKDYIRIEKEKEGFEGARYVSSPSKYMIDAVKNRYDVKWALNKVIPNSIRQVSPAQCWQLTRCTPECFLFVGRFDKIKGGDIVIRAFSRVVEKYPESKLIFVGPDIGIEGSDGTIEHIKDFIISVVPLEFRDKINYLGTLSPDEIVKLRMEAYASIVASRNETFPYSALESIAAGMPIIAAKVGGIPEILEDNYSGLLFDAGDEKALSEKIIELIEDPKKAEIISQNGYLESNQQFSSHSVAKITLDYYSEVVSHFKGNG